MTTTAATLDTLRDSFKSASSREEKRYWQWKTVFELDKAAEEERQRQAQKPRGFLSWLFSGFGLFRFPTIKEAAYVRESFLLRFELTNGFNQQAMKAPDLAYMKARGITPAPQLKPC